MTGNNRKLVYPKLSFNKVFAFIKELDKKFGTKGISYSDIFELVGTKNITSQKFYAPVTSAREMGLVYAVNKTVTITKLGEQILHPISDDSDEILQLRQTAFFNVPLYKELISKYKDGLPTKVTLSNYLAVECDVPLKEKNVAATAFLESFEELDIHLKKPSENAADELEEHGSEEIELLTPDSEVDSRNISNQIDTSRNPVVVSQHDTGQKDYKVVMPMGKGQCVSNLDIPGEVLSDKKQLICLIYNSSAPLK
ncbi:hypothetical protein [Lactiplantibacillus xiangfangensis]|uniref:hypothetical protein n=1 Tax=Lactiplantibacillus xiangfangensis TaxID=942150 RepID=UPI00384DBDC1